MFKIITSALALSVVLSQSAFAQDAPATTPSNTLSSKTKIKGKILAPDKSEIIGAIVQCGNKSVATDENGNFQLFVDNLPATLKVSYLGYANKEIVVENSDLITFELEEQSKTLSEVAIQGFANSNTEARRRAESLQETPESVTSFTKDEIKAKGITDLVSFAPYVPNINFTTSQNAGTNFMIVRGIPQIRNGESPVAVVIDGVTVQDPNIMNRELYDISLIELVKGPQGALYGKNAIGGALNIITESPSNIQKYRVDMGYSTGNMYRLGLMGSGAVIQDKLFYRVSGSFKRGDGVFKNETLNMAPDFMQDFSIRGQLKYVFNDKWTATATAQYFRTQAGAVYYAHAKAGGQTYPSAFPGFPGSPIMKPNDFSGVIDSDVLGKSELKNAFTTLKIVGNLNKVRFQSVSSYSNSQIAYSGDLDFQKIAFFKQQQNNVNEIYNQEFRLMSQNPNARFTWSIGTFFQSLNKSLVLDALIINPTTSSYDKASNFGFPPNNLSATDFTNTYNTLALFGFSDFKVTEKFTVSAGLRYDYDMITQQNRLLNTKPKTNNSQLQPKLSLSYKFMPEFMLYANYGLGYRSGGFNQEKSAVYDAFYKAETSNNFELGFKTSAFKNRLIFNAAAFYIDLSNQQQYAASFGSKGLIIGNYNYDKSTSMGFEADLKFRAMKYLDILGSFGFTEAKIVKGGKTGTTDRTSFEGNYIPFVPRYTYNAGLQSTIPISKKVSLTGLISYTSRGMIAWHDDNADFNPTYGLVDVKLGITTKTFDFGVFGNNILNQKYYTEWFAAAASGSSAGDIGWYGLPRILGANASFKF